MDFSFIGDSGLQRKEGQPQQGGGAPGQPARIAIPSFRDVQQAERPAAAPSLFRASGAAGSGHQPPPQQQPVGANTFAFLDGGPRPRAAAGLPRPAQQQQPAGPARLGFNPQPAGAAQPLAAGPYPSARPPQPYPSHPAPQQQQQYGYRPQAPQQHAPQQVYRPTQQSAQRAAPAGQQSEQQINPNAIIVSRRQEGNPLLKHIRNVRWQFDNSLVPDYMVGRDAAVLFISLRYHLLKPEYIHQRIRELQRSFRLRIILCHVDTEDAVEPLAQVTRAAIGNECTLICAWSNQECARYLETFKSYENKPAEVIQKDVGSDYVSRCTAALTTIRGVNRTDVKTLGDRFGSVSAMFRASKEELQRCPGIGPTKAKRLADTFHEPFRKTITSTRQPALAQQVQQQQPTQQQQQQQQQQQLAQHQPLPAPPARLQAQQGSPPEQQQQPQLEGPAVAHTPGQGREESPPGSTGPTGGELFDYDVEDDYGAEGEEGVEEGWGL